MAKCKEVATDTDPKDVETSPMLPEILQIHDNTVSVSVDLKVPF